ncbi:hypothetical protein ACHMW6_28880 [Pseudoduganella sp. UC29_106]|uniref:hypothetical protein n=1 Tax=Pseudoduganella sp. UC29_106 TaxID=3374553 RepID=UPI0037568ADE
MKIVILVVIILGLFTVVSMATRKSGKLNEKTNSAIAATATCVRYFIHGVLAFLGFSFAMFIAHNFFNW